MTRKPASDLPLALESLELIRARLQGKRPVVFCDFDGTLTPIMPQPDQAWLAPSMRVVLAALAARFPVAVISGRDRADVARRVGLPNLIYAGCHGFDIAAPGGLKLEHEAGLGCLPALDQVEACLRLEAGRIPGAIIERKRFSLAIHYRNVAPAEVPLVERAVDGCLAGRDNLRKGLGKKVFELRPAADWHKGQAILWLMQGLDLGPPAALPFYLGDDLTDEDAFAALAGLGVGLLVEDHASLTAAEFRLRDIGETEAFLQWLADFKKGTGIPIPFKG